MENQPFGLFTLHGAPKKNFHAFKAFRALLDTPLRAATAGGEPGRSAVLAGSNRAGTAAAMLAANLRSGDATWRLTGPSLPWTGATRVEIGMLYATHNLERTRTERFPAGPFTWSLQLPAPAVALIQLRPVAE